MTDELIVSLYWQRNDAAIKHTADKYERYLTVIAKNILNDIEESKECVNETYLKAWNSMPEQRPDALSAYLAAITRTTALDVYRSRHRSKRIPSELTSSLDELGDMLSANGSPESELDYKQLARAIDKYLSTVPPQSRTAFIRRYYFFDSVKDIADGFGFSRSKVKSILFRTRQGLAEYLRNEGFTI